MSPSRFAQLDCRIDRISESAMRVSDAEAVLQNAFKN